jgi:hypothetical protein
LVVHVVLGKGIQPLILHHVRRQNALFTPVFLGASRGNNCREKLHWTLHAEFHQATADYRASHELICGHEGDADSDVIQHRDAAGVMPCADAYAIGFTLRRETET